ncbi:fructose-2,6-bisphosphatase [Lysinibacillus sphaericus]|uniref:histidine phosphatase family protein n=1 Tax=Lysinibacillus sphaericus TaxID=1421 RepID=UPI0018CFA18A|nr:histidine phosphatase family protein [Lysinibacillus sphaericus]MBG9456228.1 fructose-2,6-bisphosphatase [Lysinibacillus sphaericus]MBG9479224.1 fructose-2,6-bisphosphatase [Lysinibacillus sphaericus]MBG9591478.1 fructose-2,6-bisphosphatase [Lysinibacillus sphaericus]
MIQTIYLLRHGETEFNTQGRYQGELDSPLTEVGVQQVQQNAQMLKSLIGNPDEWKIVSSPLGRAMQSTEIICETIGYDVKKVEKDERLTEVAVGQWAGLTTKEIESSWPNLFQNTDVYNWYFNAPDGEAYDSVVSRLSAWLKDIQHVPNVIAISHGLTGRVLRGIYADLKKEDALKLEVSQDVFFKLTDNTITRICSDFDDVYFHS